MTKKKSKQVIRTEPCPDCRSRGEDKSGNNLVVYEDGKKWCFNCNDKRLMGEGFIEGDYYDLMDDEGWLARGIKEETCRQAQYIMGQYTGWIRKRDGGKRYAKKEWCQVAQWFDKTGKLTAQKLRFKDKSMKFIGNAKNLPFWGMHDYQPTDKLFIVITGGEIDRLSIMQAWKKYHSINCPVVSPPTGEGSLSKCLEQNLKEILQYKYVVFALDNDEAGQKAMQKAAELLDVDKVRFVTWPTKDPNELTQEGREKEIVEHIWNAKINAPDALVTAHDLVERVLKQPQFGVSYPWETMTEITYGSQEGEIHIIVGANGIGKTEFITKLIFHDIDKHDSRIGLFSFEQDPEDTLRRLIGARLGIKLHLPGADWDEQKITKELNSFDDRIFLCERAGSISHDELFRSIVYWAKAKGVKKVYIDNIRGLGIGHDVEMAGAFMRKLQTMCRMYKISVYLLSHVAKDKYVTQVYTSTSPKNKEAYDEQTVEDVEKAVKKPGMDWESGRMPTTVNIDGPSVFGDLANYIWSLGRNKVSDDPDEQSILKVKCLKARLDGRMTGLIFKLRYTEEGNLKEVNIGAKHRILNTERYIDEDERPY